MDTLIPRQIKCRKVPIHIQDRVSEDLMALIKDAHDKKLGKTYFDRFLNPIVITATKYSSIKLAMDTKPLNAQIWKNKYQVPNIPEIIDLAAQINTSDVPGLV